ncbi:MAG: uroporphyrinogen-III synthase [Zetaproteobacteria bacterium]|nr:MAG: uroporphyrinogen-III synthase [Zetaproteobacteria bacterium]
MSVDRPLERKTILITRERQQQLAVAKKVRARGGIPLAFPCLELEPKLDNIKKAIATLRQGDHVIFTSSNGVHCFSRACERLPAEVLEGMHVCAVGSQTAKALREIGIESSIVGDPPSQKGLIHAFEQAGIPHRAFFFRAEKGSDQLVRFLREHGCETHLVVAYRMRCPTSDASHIVEMIKRGEIDAVLLGSALTVHHYAHRIGHPELASRPVLVVISEQAAEQAKRDGLHVQVVAKTASFDAMLDALEHYFAQQEREDHDTA